MRNWSKNKRKWLLSMVVVALLGAAFHAGTVFGAGAEPGSSGDPLITQSYLEEQLKDISSGGFHKIKVPARQERRLFYTAEAHRFPLPEDC